MITNNKTEKIIKFAAKFKSLKYAQGYANKGRANDIVHGDDGRYWVVTMGEAEYLVKLGYERAPRWSEF